MLSSGLTRIFQEAGGRFNLQQTMESSIGHGTTENLLTILLVLLGSLPVVLLPRLLTVVGGRYRLAAWAFFVVTRVGFLAVLYMAFGRAVGPDSDTWVLHGTSVLQGMRPYIDFPSEYGPLFSVLLAPAFAVFPATVAPIMVFILFDGLVVLLMHRIDDFGDTARRAAALYLVSPISWFMVVRYGQDETIGAAALVGILLLDQRGRRWSAVVLTAVATLFTKVLFPITAAAVLLRRRRAWLHCSVVAFLVAVAYSPFLISKGDLILWVPGNAMRVGPNFWQLIEPVFEVESQTAMAVVLVVTAILGLTVMFRGDRISVPEAGLGIYGGFMLFSPKAWTPYALLFLPLFCLYVARTPSIRNLILFAIYGVLVNLYILVYPALWVEAGAGWRLVAHIFLALLVISHAGLVVVFVRKAVSP